MTAQRKSSGEPGEKFLPKKMPVPWRMYSLIAILGLGTIYMVSYGFHKGLTMAATHAPQVDAAMEIKLEATTARLLFEKVINEVPSADINSVSRHLRQAEWYAQAMLEGGRNEEGIFLPLQNAHMRAKIGEIKNRLATLRKAMQDKAASEKGGNKQSKTLQQYQALFDNIIEETDDVETQLQYVLALDLRRFRWTQWGLIATCFLLWSTIGMILHRFERRWSALLRASNEANESLLEEMAQRKRAEEALQASEHRYRSVVEDTPGMVCRFLPGGEITYVNNAYCEYFGKTREELVGNSFESLISEEDRQSVMAQISSLTVDSATKSLEQRVAAPDGSIRWQRWTNRALFNDEGQAVVYQAFGEDITERKQAELDLRKTQAELIARERREKELVEAELAKARKELINATRLATLGQLTATVSHELRNPLGSIRTAVFSVAEEVRGQKPLVDRALARAERNIMRCDQIIEELLDYTRTKKPEPKLTDIDPWLGEVLGEQNIPRHITVTRNPGANVKLPVDREQLRRCVINLLANACQAMSEGEPTTARLTVETAVKDKRLLIHVRDTGQGITPDKMEKIFEPLYTTKGFGIGLGLPVVEQLMRQLGGGVFIKSDPDQGTTATLWLPLTPEKDL